MSMEYIREYYKVPAKRGMSVKYQGKLGLIVGADGAYLKIRLNGESEIRLYHPTWELEYLDMSQSPTEEQGTVTREGNPMYVYGIKTQTGQHIDVSLSEKGAKQYATRHGYIVVTRRDAMHYYVTEIAKKNESGGWVSIKGNT